jgi:3-methyladenine DNA glycosylase AlkD
MLAAFEFIKQKELEDAFKIAEILLNDEHDLIHKAVGWMLREAGKRAGLEKEEEFLQKHYRQMPRTMLRYAIERMPEGKRKMYLGKG